MSRSIRIASKDLIIKDGELASEVLKRARDLVDDGWDVSLSSQQGKIILLAEIALPAESDSI